MALTRRPPILTTEGNTLTSQMVGADPKTFPNIQIGDLIVFVVFASGYAGSGLPGGWTRALYVTDSSANGPDSATVWVWYKIYDGTESAPVQTLSDITVLYTTHMLVYHYQDPTNPVPVSVTVRQLANSNYLDFTYTAPTVNAIRLAGIGFRSSLALSSSWFVWEGGGNELVEHSQPGTSVKRVYTGLNDKVAGTTSQVTERVVSGHSFDNGVAFVILIAPNPSQPTTVVRLHHSVWNIKRTIAQLYHIKWNVLSVAAKTTRTNWNVYQRFAASTGFLWRIKDTTVVSATLETTWNALGIVAKTSSTVWGITNTVGNDVAVLWKNLWRTLWYKPKGKESLNNFEELPRVPTTWNTDSDEAGIWTEILPKDEEESNGPL